MKRPLGLILTGAFFLRVLGIGYGLPHIYHQDEPMMVNHALAIGVGDWNTHYFVIPPFLNYFLFVLYAVYFVLGSCAGTFHGKDSFLAAYLADPTAFYLLGRFFASTLFGTATVALIARLGKEFFSETTGLLAALFLSVALIHVQQSHYIYADTMLAFAITAVLYFFLKMTREPSLRNFLIAGALLGWAGSVKYTAAYLFPALLATLYFALDKKQAAAVSLKKTAALAATALGVFVMLAPYTFLDWKHFWATMMLQKDAESYVGIFHHFSYSILQGTGALFAALALVGVFSLAKIRPRESGVLGAFLAVFYLVNTFFAQHFARYVLPMIPALCLFAAAGWGALSERWRGSPLFKNCFLAAVVLSMAVPSFYSDILFCRKDTRTLCKEWIEKNNPVNSTIVVDNRFFAPRLVQTQAQLEEKQGLLSEGPEDVLRKKRLALLLKTPPGQKRYRVYTMSEKGEERQVPFLSQRPFVKTDWRALEGIGADYLILNTSDFEPAGHDLKDRNEDRFVRAVFFSPYRDASQKKPLDPYASTAAPMALSDIFARTRLGPVLEVYKVKK